MSGLTDNTLLRHISGADGSDLYVGAGTYKTSDGSLKANCRTIYIREDQTAMITSMKLAEAVHTGNKIGAALKAGDIFTFNDDITEIIISGGSFIGY